MGDFFTAILYQPIFNAFVGLYNVLPDVGLVILVITVVIKLVLYPLTRKSIAAQKSLQELQPKLEEMKKTYKDDQQRLAQETMKLYKEHKVNPFGSCLPLLIQLPIFLALFWVLRGVLTTDNFDLLYSFVANPGHVEGMSLGLINLGEPNLILAVLAGGAQFWQSKSLMRKKPPKEAGEGGKDEGMAAMVNKQMLYMMPLMTVLIGASFPGGVTLYWFLSTLFTAVQQHIMFHRKKKNGETNETDSDVIEGEIVEEKSK